MREQGMDFDADKGSFELDHIVPLALGGHPRNPKNLALQAWEAGSAADWATVMARCGPACEFAGRIRMAAYAAQRKSV